MAAPVPWISTADTGRKVCDHYCRFPAIRRTLREFGFKPLPTSERLLTHCFSIECPPVAGRAHESQEVVAGAHRRGTPRLAEEIEIAPAHGADETHAPAGPVGNHEPLALEQRPAQRRGPGAQPAPGLGQIATIELMVAGHEDHRHRPPGETVEAGPAGVDVAGQHQQLGARCGFGFERLGLEVQVGQQLQLQARVRRNARAALRPPAGPRSARACASGPAAGGRRASGTARHGARAPAASRHGPCRSPARTGPCRSPARTVRA